MLKELLKYKSDSIQNILYQRLEQVQGFLCHLSMVSDVITPYLKGFHLKLAKHLPQRDGEGWKFTDAEFVGHVEGKLVDGEYTREQ